MIDVNSSINNDMNDDYIFHSINDCYSFMKRNVIMIIVDEKFINDFH